MEPLPNVTHDEMIEYFQSKFAKTNDLEEREKIRKQIDMIVTAKEIYDRVRGGIPTL